MEEIPLEERELEEVEGSVSALIYQNEENGYTILRLDRRGEELTVVGAMPGVAPGEKKEVSKIVFKIRVN